MKTISFEKTNKIERQTSIKKKEKKKCMFIPRCGLKKEFVLWKKCLFLQNAKNMIDAPEEAQSTH